MGSKIHFESYLPVHYAMRDLNEDSSSSSWPLCYGDKPAKDGYTPRATLDLCLGSNKDALKRKMLEHEAVFKDQVYELHCLYRRQRDIMEEAWRNESTEPSSSSSLRGYQVPSEDARKLHMAGFPLSSSHSPMGCSKENVQLPSQIVYQNGWASKESEASGTRSLKVRKRMFDLQLPPEECINLEERERSAEIKVSDFSSYGSNANLRTDYAGPEPACRIVASSSASWLRNPTGLADLNEPVVMEEPPPSLLGRISMNGESRGIHVGINGGTTHVLNGFLIDSVESKVHNAGSDRSNPRSSNHGIQQDKFSISSHPGTGVLNLINHPPGSHPSGCCREDSWRVGNHQSSQVHPSFFGSCLPGSWPRPSSSWTKPKSSSSLKMELSSSPSQIPWQVGATSTSYQHMEGQPMMVNGYYQGSTSGSKDLRARLSSGFDYHSNAASNQAVNNGFGNFPKGSSHVDTKRVLDINLNEAFSKDSVDEADPGSRNGKGKQEGRLPTLPWLKQKPADPFSSKSETIRDLNQLIAPEVVSLASSSGSEVLIKKDTQNAMKILGVPVFEMDASEKKPSTNSTIDCCQEMNNDGKDRKRRIIDINLECVPEAEEEVTVEKEKRAKVGSFRVGIDLNSCASDHEDPSATSYQSQAGNVKATLEIDLEAPVVLDEDDNTSFKQDMVSELSSLQTEELNDEVTISAAETMVTVSSFCLQVHIEESGSRHMEASLAESLLQFASALSNGFIEEIDEFESMALQLEETKEEEYMPKPFLPKIHNLEELGANALSLSTRPRRGQSRRGRQRRDFQRDILPGMTTLFRHEVTEDLQIFMGVMRATGHYWTSGLTRRNGMKTRGGRGRRRLVAEPVPAVAVPISACTPLVQQVNNIEGGLEDRSLTGWGKMPRRPRCQRYPSGNPSTVVLT